MITKQKALKIASKLEAKPDKTNKNRPHDLYVIRDDANIRVASFGISRSSKKDIGQGHISRDLHINDSEAEKIYICDWWRKQYFSALRQRGRTWITG